LIHATDDDIKRLHAYYKDHTSVNYKEGQLEVSGIPIIWARAELLFNLYTETENIVSDAAHALMQRIAFPHGEHFYNVVLDRFVGNGSKPSNDSIIHYLCAETGAIGWGFISVEIRDDIVEIICPKGFTVGKEAARRGMTIKEPVDSYFLGYFEGFFSRLLEWDFRGEELECVAMGDPQCRIVLKRRGFK